MAKVNNVLGFVLLQSVLLIAAVDAQNFTSCVTPKGENGACTTLEACPSLNSLFQGLRTNMDVQVATYLRNSQCDQSSNQRVIVCCPSKKNSNDNRTADSSSVLPSVCGRDLSLRVFGGERTDIDEFPWMALIEYSHPNGISTSCGGVLISKRYVLTAAHCMDRQALPSTWNPTGVRLGEYDTSNSIDCLSVDDAGSQICAQPTLTIGIERKIVHEAYRAGSIDQKYDIALVRMSEDVTFTDFISPICLPSAETVPAKAWIAGWGKTENNTNSQIKLKLELPIANFQYCVDVYSGSLRQVGTGQICAGGQRGKDSCRGDSGGPLMYADKNMDSSRRWTAIGIVSYGPSPCGMQGWPGVYTKVFDYIPWINSKLLP